MTDCNCQTTPVSDFTVSGFNTEAVSLRAETQKQLENVQALKLSVCVSASYNTSTNKICFTIPIYGDYCINSPIPIPVGGELKACAQTCGSIIPTGLKATIYLQGAPIYTVVLWGDC